MLSTRAHADVAELSFVREVLENGLTVVYHRDDRVPAVAVAVWYDVGALHEQPGRSGFAHLFEHMMFQGSAHIPRDTMISGLERRGATQINGTTAFDRTLYHEVMPSSELPYALWLESDRMGWFLAALDQQQLDNQKDVVKAERRDRVNDRPYGLVDGLVMHTLYPQGHPYRENVIGSAKDVDAATLDEIRAFFLQHYVPANATLVLAGDFEVPEAKELVRKYFASLPARPRPAGVKVDPPELRGTKLFRATEPIANQPRLTLVWGGPPPYGAGAAELDYAASLMADPGVGWLDDYLRAAGVEVIDVSASFLELRGGSRFELHVVVPEGTQPEPLIKLIDRFVLTLSTHAQDQRDIDAYRNSLERGTLFRNESLLNRATLLAAYESMFDDPGKLAWDLERYKLVTPESLRRVVLTTLGQNRIAVFAEPAKGAIQKKAQK
ncbi:MAG: insulinase family protein [Deltaproteobacteria bacterium]|nr:insulinase family protein [Deltaproteobacteria bacterium]